MFLISPKKFQKKMETEEKFDQEAIEKIKEEVLNENAKAIVDCVLKNLKIQLKLYLKFDLTEIELHCEQKKNAMLELENETYRMKIIEDLKLTYLKMTWRKDLLKIGIPKIPGVEQKTENIIAWRLFGKFPNQ